MKIDNMLPKVVCFFHCAKKNQIFFETAIAS